MKIQNNNLFILHIRDAIAWIDEYTLNKNYLELERDHMLQDAIIRQIMIIGEASKSLPESLKTEYAEIPWKKIVGSRDKMIHDYADVQIDIVWNIVKNELPILKKVLGEYIEKHKSEIDELEKDVEHDDKPENEFYMKGVL